MAADLRETIARIASEEGIDPAYALAVADRESKFDPNAKASKSMYGLFQMSGALRDKYGVPQGADPETQTRGFARFSRDLKSQMAKSMGRDPSNSELYLGHFWGGDRASRVLGGGHAGAAPSDVFSPRELAENPQLAKATNVGGLAATITADMNQRQAKYGGSNGTTTAGRGRTGADFSVFGSPTGFDFSTFGQPLEDPSTEKSDKNLQAETGTRPGKEIDLAQFGLPAAQPATTSPAAGAIRDYNDTSDFLNRPVAPAQQQQREQQENNLVPPAPLQRSA